MKKNNAAAKPNIPVIWYSVEILSRSFNIKTFRVIRIVYDFFKTN